MTPAIEAVRVPSPAGRGGETHRVSPARARRCPVDQSVREQQRPAPDPAGEKRPPGVGGRWAGALAPGRARISAALGQGRCPCHGGRVRPFTPAVAASSAACRRLKARHDLSRPDRDVCPGSSRTTRGIPRRQLSARRVCPPGGAATALPVGPPRTPTQERPAGRITAGSPPGRGRHPGRQGSNRHPDRWPRNRSQGPRTRRVARQAAPDLAGGTGQPDCADCCILPVVVA